MNGDLERTLNTPSWLADISRRGLKRVEDSVSREQGQITVKRLALLVAEAELHEWECPPAVCRFVESFGQAQDQLKSILDVWAGVGTLVLPLVQAIEPERAVGLCPAPEFLNLIRRVEGHEQVEWRVGDPIAELSESCEEFDMVVGCLPVGMRKGELNLDYGGCEFLLKDTRNNLIIASACRLLVEDGVGVFVVGPRLAFPNLPGSFFSQLGSMGLYVDAYVSTPPGTWKKTSVPFGLAFIRRGEAESLFIGELSNIPARNKVLLENLLERRVGGDVGLGRIVRYSTFQSYQHLVGQERVAELEDRLKLPGIPLVKIASAINLTKAKEPPGFEEEDNAIYVPLIGRSEVRTLLSDLTLKPHNYAQVVLDDSQVDARYVAGFLNSPDGMIVRESVLSGVHIPKITKASIQYMPVFLPDLGTSRAVLTIDTQLRELQSELSELRGALWANPLDVEDAAERLSRVNRNESLVDWLEALPFPLATILWAYWTDRDDDLRSYKRLLHFFEALAELLAVILLSAFRNDSQLFAHEWGAIRSTFAETGATLDLSTFGLWVRIYERLAKTARGLLSGEQQKAVSNCGELFRSRDIEAVSSLLSPSIVGVLQKANSHRNKDAHGGAVGEAEARRRHTALRDLLETARAEFAGAWSRFLMLMPSSMEFEDGLYMTTSKAILGTRTPFDSLDVSTNHPLAKNHLYLMGCRDEMALELQPLVKIMPSPQSEDNACYFYSRREDGKARFVSYHFDAASEVLIDALDTLAFLDELMQL